LAKLDWIVNAELQYYDDANCLYVTVLKELGCRFQPGGLMGCLKAVASVRTAAKMAKQSPTEVLDSLPRVTGSCKL